MAKDSNSEGSVETEITIESSNSVSIPRARGINQFNNSTSESTSSSIPHSNYGPNADNLNNQNSPALGQRRMHNNDLDKSDLNDKNSRDLDKDKKDSDKDNEADHNNSNNKEGKDSTPNSNNASIPSADPNNNMNANAANMNSNKPPTDPNNSDNKFGSRNGNEAPANNNAEKTTSSDSSKSALKSFFSTTLSDVLQDPVKVKRIVIGTGIVFAVGAGALAVFISLFLTFSSSMCDNSGTFLYSGSGDIAEFMCGMQEPTEGYTVTSNFGYSVDDVHSGRLHSGIDLGVSTGTPVYAVQSGKVVATNTTSNYGNDVVIDHGGGVFTRYAHNSKLLVSKDDFVNRGQQIAEAGNTGYSFGSHVHFEIMKTTETDLFSGHQDPNAYFNQHDDFMNSCGSYASATFMSYTPSTVETGSAESYQSLKTLQTIKSSTGTKKTVYKPAGYAFQSFAYSNGSYYLQSITRGATGKDGYVYMYDSKINQKKVSPKIQPLGHGNGFTYSTADNKLYSVTVSGIRDNSKATIIDPSTLAVIDHKSLDHGTSSIAYDRITNRFITSSGASDRKASSTGYLYVYDSNLSRQVGAKKIAKKRWKTPGDIAAYGGVIYVCVHQSVGDNYIDMYNEDTGEYLGSYSAPYQEIEGIDIDDSGQIVLLFHGNTSFIQFTGIEAKVINNKSDSGGSFSGGSQCCTDSSPSYTSTSGGNYCPNGITVTGRDAGTYDLDDYVDRVVTCENGGANEEALKALAVAARTYALNRTDNCKNSIENSTNAQVMSTPNCTEASDKVKNAISTVRGSVLLYNGDIFSTQYSTGYGSNNGTCPSSGSCTLVFKKSPSDEKSSITVPHSFLSFQEDGTYLIGHDSGLSQNGSNYMASQGKTYQEILEFFYADGIEITGASSGGSSCSLGAPGTYTNGKVWDYNQADYSDPYCDGTIADSGCGPTAMAMVVSTFLKEKHDPPELAKVTTDTGYCATLTHDYFKKAAEKYNLTYQKLEEGDSEEVLTALNRGDSLVIANVTSKNKVDGLDNFWTEEGHYIVLAGHEGRNVWVQDPNKGMPSVHRTNTKGDGVYDFDKYIKPAATNGYMIFKKA